MRAVIQRVKRAQVSVDGEVVSKIGKGLLVLIGVGNKDTHAAADYIAEKIINLRIFEDAHEKMNLSLKDISGELLVVSQFTLYGDCRKGKRPSFTDSARPDIAKSIFDYLLDKLSHLGVTNVQSGVFAAHMDVELINDGPVTILIDSDKAF
ncbi:D-aminoacyl-tRNA deacylase [Heliophilum fasciatum]|uniref:D-aminoacyl-tRNA deacylase n=1 Tax=Heliophilum fasciatum TaxID=35700 RepID=A0A4R2RA10_9FIRM|nr:D-aminoacyl-tRNA deacylase [Heliophilum fasciatum]MCW2279395.1 D-tyrosyl-tRNA(Tyr) deacylase [Heliophilum fasciatum]TCP60092.1 D-tyrosyl-tRNA(Tyr) deacylase [Heliophilum fasciatum]